MKINETGRINVYRTYANTSDQRTGKTAGTSRKDEVHISSQAQELLGANGDAARLSKLETIKQQVASGTYHVEAGKVAEKLLPFFM